MESLVATAFWVIAAQVVAMLPSRDSHWRAAYVLIAAGVPLLAWVFWQNGPWIGLLVLAAGMSILRWPVFYAWRWVRGRLMGGSKD